MAKRVMRWEDHSRAWRAKAAAEGMTSKRYNAWLSLSPETQKKTSQREYAAGTSVPVQRRQQLEREAVKSILRASGGNARPSYVRRNVGKMSTDELKWTANATPNQIRSRASRKVKPGQVTNPWWYR